MQSHRKVCAARPGQIVQILTNLAAQPDIYMVVRMPNEARAAQNVTTAISSHGLNSDHQDHFLINLQTGDLLHMPHLSLRCIVRGKGQIVFQDDGAQPTSINIGPADIGPGKSVTVAAAESLEDLLQGPLPEPMNELINAGLHDNEAVLQRLIHELKRVATTANGATRQKAIEALRRTDPALLDSDEEIRATGMAMVTYIGSENVYLERNGQSYYFKPGNTEAFSVGIHDFTNETVFG